MDETMVHCFVGQEKADVSMPFTLPDGEKVIGKMNKRPYLKQFLVSCRKFFEIVVFTASHQAYADSVLDYLDPHGTLIDYRFYRQHCTKTPKGFTIKDLRRLSHRRLEDIVIIDNSAYCFGQ